MKVNIAEYNGSNNITEVTNSMPWLQMAGVKDVIITVTADKSVSGESAPTGATRPSSGWLNVESENTQVANGPGCHPARN